MRNKLGTVAYLAACAFIIAVAIYNGQKHYDHCRECRLALDNNGSSKFAGK